LENGLTAGIEFLVEQIQKTGKYQIQWKGSGLTMHINPNHALFIYRIFQEAIQNIIRHAEATEVIIELSETDQMYCLRVSDNGKGFDMGSKQGKNGLGVRSMAQRAMLIGAEILTDTAPGRGTTITLKYKNISDDNTGIGR